MNSTRPVFLIAVALLVGTTVSPGIAAETDTEPVKSIEVGDRAIDFDLPVIGEKEYLTLSDEFRQGPVVVIVLRGYPGYQCPLCKSQVGSLINRAKTLGKVAHRVILVYPGETTLLDRHAEQFMGSRSLPDPLVLVRDDELKMVQEWGLRWNAPKETAYPATFVIDRNGRVKWKKVSQSHAGRSTTEQILKELRKL